MKTIYKYPLSLNDSFTLNLPYGHDTLDIQIQNDTPVLWAMVDTENETREVRFKVVGTGWSIEKAHSNNYFVVDDKCSGWYTYVATIQWRGFVWHIFEEH